MRPNKIRTGSGYYIAIVLAATVTAATAQNEGLLPVPDYTTNFSSRAYLLGDLGGWRTKGAEKGIQADIQWTQIGQTVTDGGRELGGKYGGNLDYNIKLDLAQMGLLPGALISIRMESRYGESVNGTAGPVLPVNTDSYAPMTETLDENIALTVTAFNYMQFLNEQFAVMLGKFDTFDGDPSEFASGRGTRQFMNFNLIYTSTGALLPYSTLGGGIFYMPANNISITSMLSTLQDSSTSSGFDDFGDGWIWSTEADTQFKLGALPGGFNLGAVLGGNGDFTRLDKNYILPPGGELLPPTDDSTWNAYATAWQYLFADTNNEIVVDPANGKADLRGVGIFSRIGFADKKTNPAQFSFSLGLGGRGLFPRRDLDNYGLGYFFINLSDIRVLDTSNFDDESQGLELFYTFVLAEAVELTLDAQYVNSPLPSTDSATILGARLNLVF